MSKDEEEKKDGDVKDSGEKVVPGLTKRTADVKTDKGEASSTHNKPQRDEKLVPVKQEEEVGDVKDSGEKAVPGLTKLTADVKTDKEEASSTHNKPQRDEKLVPGKQEEEVGDVKDSGEKVVPGLTKLTADVKTDKEEASSTHNKAQRDEKLVPGKQEEEVGDVTASGEKVVPDITQLTADVETDKQEASSTHSKARDDEKLVPSNKEEVGDGTSKVKDGEEVKDSERRKDTTDKVVSQSQESSGQENASTSHIVLDKKVKFEEESCKTTNFAESVPETEASASTSRPIDSNVPTDSDKEIAVISPVNRINRLYLAACKGDWKTTESILESDPSFLTEKLTIFDETLFHIAVNTRNVSFIKKLVGLMSPPHFGVKNKFGDTGFIIVVRYGLVEIAEIILQIDITFLMTRDSEDQIPLVIAMNQNNREMVSLLHSKIKIEELDACTQMDIFIGSIASDFYDIASEHFKFKPSLAWTRSKNGDTAVHVLARKSPATISSKRKLNSFKSIMHTGFKKFYRKDTMSTVAHQLVVGIAEALRNFTTNEFLELINIPTRILHDAARAGNINFIIIFLNEFPTLLSELDDRGNSIFHVAVKNRQEETFSYLFEWGGSKDILVKLYNKDNDSLLHLAAKLPAPQHLNRVSGAVLQMQRELIWFKAVEKAMVASPYEARHSTLSLSRIKVEEPPSHSGNGQPPPPKCLTPRELFSKEHGEVLKNAKERMKSMAQTCMPAALLVAAGVFAAIFMLPGGTDPDRFLFNLRSDPMFVLLIASNSMALGSSLTSLFFFISIFTSYFTEENFQKILPVKLLCGLMLLILAIMGLMSAFCATVILVYHKEKTHLLLIFLGVLTIPIVSVFCFIWKDVAGILHNLWWDRSFLMPCRKRMCRSYTC